VTPSGIETATFRLAAQGLKQQHHRVPIVWEVTKCSFTDG